MIPIEAIKAKIAGAGLVRDKDGNIKIDNPKALTPELRAEIQKTSEVQEHGRNTSNSSA